MLAGVMNMELRIRDLREDRDLKQKEVAAYLMCDQSLYSKYERGERPLPLEYADKLADFYRVSVDYLMGRTNVKKPYPSK
jgi:transcriptional regulator with XRE-family HTH domain